METVLLIVLIIIALFLFLSRILKNQNKSESELGIFEHPATFKKPGIEMVSEIFTQEKNSNYHIGNSIEFSNKLMENENN